MRTLHQLVMSLVFVLLTVAAPAWAGPIAALPPALNFPDTGVGAVSPLQLLTFKNNGNQAVNVTDFVLNGVNPQDFEFESMNQPGFSIGPGVGFDVSVRFKPTLGGTRNATFTVKVGGGLGDATVQLTGKGIGQKLTVTPGPINAGGTKVNVTTQTKVEVQNTGGGTVKVSNITVTGANANEFVLSGLPPFPAALGPGGAGKFTVTLSFTPAFQGAHTAALNVFSDDPNLGPNLITNISGLAGDPRIGADIGMALFGNLRVGLAGMPLTINISNSGNSDLKVSQVVLDAGPMGGFNPADFVLDRAMLPNNTILPAMASKPITITFKPTAIGVRMGRLVIVSDDPNTPARYISLVGTGTFAMLGVAPPSIDFGDQTTFLASKPVAVTFTNSGTDAAAITEVSFGGANATWFRTSGIVKLPLVVPANGSVKIDLIALPLGLGNGSGTVTFKTDDPMTPALNLLLKVVGVGATVKLTPSFGDFMTIGVLAKSTQDFTLCNVGSGELRIEDFRFIDPMQCSCFQLVNAPMPDMNGEWPRLAPGQCLKFSVLFSPQVEGAFNAQIEIDTDDPMARHIRLPLGGSGAQAGLLIDPNGQPINFGTVVVGSVAPPKNLTIKNSGGADLTINSLTLAGQNPNQFHIEDPGKFTLHAGQSKVVPVSYQPVGAGAHSASVVITPAGFAPAQVKLTGVAVQQVIQVATGQNPPNVADFDQVQMTVIGAESDAFSVGIKVPPNGVAVSLGDIRSSNPGVFRVDTSMTKMDLGPGQQTLFNIFFRPSSGMLTSAVITIPLRGSSSPPMSITAKGTGTSTAPWPDPEPGCAMSGRRSLPGALSVLLALPAVALLLRRRRARRTDPALL